MGLCCCLSLQKAVVTIGVISMLSSSILVVMNLVIIVTFEEHIKSCRIEVAGAAASHTFKHFPSCELLTHASVLMAARIFIYIQLLVWIAEVFVSILLVVAAVKRRSNFLVPWAVVSFLVVLTLIWNIYQASSQASSNLSHLLLLIFSLLISLYFLLVVRSFGVQVTRRRSSRCCEPTMSFISHLQQHGYLPEELPLPDAMHDYKKYTSSGRPSCSSVNSSMYGDHPVITKLPSIEVMRSLSGRLGNDLPPAYTPFTREEKGALPNGLGVKH